MSTLKVRNILLLLGGDMANNRIYIKCCCGSESFLAKRFDTPYYLVTKHLPALETWFEEHEFCGEPASRDHFELVYESKRDWEWH
jgi:hypothetical protein